MINSLEKDVLMLSQNMNFSSSPELKEVHFDEYITTALDHIILLKQSQRKMAKPTEKSKNLAGKHEKSIFDFYIKFNEAFSVDWEKQNRACNNLKSKILRISSIQTKRAKSKISCAFR